MPRSEQDIIDTAVADLEHFRTRIGMYIGRADVMWATMFLNGFGLGLSASGVRLEKDAMWKAQADRGWRMAASGPVDQMEAKGMDAHAIINELVGIEILILRRYTIRSE